MVENLMKYIVILVNYRVIWDIIGEDNIIIAYGDKWILADYIGNMKERINYLI